MIIERHKYDYFVSILSHPINIMHCVVNVKPACNNNSMKN